MSHFTVMVIGDNPDSQLLPYDENIQTEPISIGDVSESKKEEMISFYKKKEIEFSTFEDLYTYKGEEWNSNSWKIQDGKWVETSTYNPNSKWDWYTLGGRWTGFLKIKEGKNGSVGRPGLMTSSPKTGYADCAKKSDIDFEGMKSESAIKAGEYYDKVMSVIEGTPKNIPWETYLKRHKDGEISIDKARELYHDQPRLKAIKTREACEKIGYITDIDKFSISKEEYVEKARNSSISTYALVKDGQWYEKGEMGWFGISKNETDQNDWNKRLSDIIDNCSEETLISIYDCHI